MNGLNVLWTKSAADALVRCVRGGAESGTLPNLTPYKPSGWSDKIVVSTTTGTTIDSDPLGDDDTRP
jgi:hypothetical protein